MLRIPFEPFVSMSILHSLKSSSFLFQSLPSQTKWDFRLAEQSLSTRLSLLPKTREFKSLTLDSQHSWDRRVADSSKTKKGVKTCLSTLHESTERILPLKMTMNLFTLDHDKLIRGGLRIQNRAKAWLSYLDKSSKLLKLFSNADFSVWRLVTSFLFSDFNFLMKACLSK